MLLTFNFFPFQTIKILRKFTSVILETQGIFKFSVKDEIKTPPNININIKFLFPDVIYAIDCYK